MRRPSPSRQSRKIEKIVESLEIYQELKLDKKLKLLIGFLISGTLFD